MKYFNPMQQRAISDALRTLLPTRWPVEVRCPACQSAQHTLNVEPHLMRPRTSTEDPVAGVRDARGHDVLSVDVECPRCGHIAHIDLREGA